MSRDFPVTGLAEIDKFLSHFPMNLQKGAYRAGLTAAAAVVRDEARARVPRKTGKLAAAIRTGSSRQNQDGSFSIKVELKGNDHAFLGLFMEYGVAPHFITPGSATQGGVGLSARLTTRKANAEGLASDVTTHHLRIGKQIISGAVFHPGFPPRPFMRPALDLKAGEAVQAFAGRIRAYIEGKSGFVVPVDEAA